jgi:hypothetical protein
MEGQMVDVTAERLTVQAERSNFRIGRSNCRGEGSIVRTEFVKFRPKHSNFRDQCCDFAPKLVTIMVRRKGIKAMSAALWPFAHSSEIRDGVLITLLGGSSKPPDGLTAICRNAFAS